MTDILIAIENEAARAHSRYGDFTSTHEALGVLIEEMDELRAAIRSNKLASVESEAIQVAAVATRLATLCREAQTTPDTPFGSRSVP